MLFRYGVYFDSDARSDARREAKYVVTAASRIDALRLLADHFSTRGVISLSDSFTITYLGRAEARHVPGRWIDVEKHVTMTVKDFVPGYTIEPERGVE